MKKTLTMTLALSSLLALKSAYAHELPKGVERCFGIAKKGMNDCAAKAAGKYKAHACAGKALIDGQSNEWIAVPKGTCKKIVGASSESEA